MAKQVATGVVDPLHFDYVAIQQCIDDSVRWHENLTQIATWELRHNSTQPGKVTERLERSHEIV
jgi:hypothetical protein